MKIDSAHTKKHSITDGEEWLAVAVAMPKGMIEEVTRVDSGDT